VFNAQEQPKVTWPATTVVARAYLDQLNRTKGIAADRAAAVVAAMDQADKVRSAADKSHLALELATLARGLEADAGNATGRDAMRLRALAATIKDRAGALR
jgi:hypothetical protein